MARRGKWVVVGGAAAFVVTPVAVYATSTFVDADLGGTGIVVSGTMRHLDAQQRAERAEAAEKAAAADRAAEAKRNGAPESTSPKSPDDLTDDRSDDRQSKKNGITSPDTPTRVEVPTPVTPVSPQTPADDQQFGTYDDDDDAPANRYDDDDDRDDDDDDDDRDDDDDDD